MRSGGRGALLVGVLLGLSVAVAWGAEPAAENDSERANGVPGAWEKAERGLSNITVGFLIEVPKTVAHESEAHGPLFGATAGLIKGMGLGVGRTFVGVYELLTFPTPNGVVGYAPVLEPGTPFSFDRTTRFLDTPVR
ncbi:MAG: exosortase system-associated protein, TIGR04073 family [candidate division NC10 bacterium]|nr:exosortase system-associated protein, TIGR04073 family [candidate division NC10 bacterium]